MGGRMRQAAASNDLYYCALLLGLLHLLTFFFLPTKDKLNSSSLLKEDILLLCSQYPFSSSLSSISHASYLSDNTVRYTGLRLSEINPTSPPRPPI